MSADESDDILLCACEGPVAHVRINNPARANALSAPFWEALPRLINRLDADTSLRAIVISGAGKHFTAGIDLAIFQAFAPDPAADPARQRERLYRRIRAMQETFSCLERCRKPVIAAIHGACLGAGVDMVTACDIRIASKEAFFAIQEINIGMVADVGTLQRAPHLLPHGILRELAFTGRRMSADEAYRWGFVNAVHETKDATLAAAMGLAREIAKKSPLAVAGTKEMLNYARDHRVADGLAYVASWNAGMLIGHDIMKGATAALAGETPDFDDLLA